MSDENDTPEGEGIKDLRKQYEAQKKQNEELAKELASFRAEKRTASVAEVFKAKNIPASAAKLYTGEDTSPEAVGKWIEEFADVFNVGAAASSAPDANAQAAQRVSDASHGSVDSIQNGDPAQKVLGDPAEIQRAIETLPMDELIKLGYMPKAGVLFNQRPQ